MHPAKAVERHWDKMEARHAFHHLSENGEESMLAIIGARRDLDMNKPKSASEALSSAVRHLEAALKAHEKFTAAENKLHPPTVKAVTNGMITDWIPVGGEFIASETLAPEKKQAVATANQQLRLGQTDQAAQTMAVVGENVDFVIALIPLARTQGAVNRALVFTQEGNIPLAKQALDDIINNVLFISEDLIIKTDQTVAAATSKLDAGKQGHNK